MIKQKPITTVVYLGLGLLGLMGVVGMAYRLMEGLNVTGLTSYVVWGIWVASYIYLAGLSAGAFIVSVLYNSFDIKEYENLVLPSLIVAFFSLIGALCFAWLDLGHPLRFLYLYIYPNWNSVMTWEAWGYLFYLTIILATIFLWLRPRNQGNKRSLKVLGFIGLFFALTINLDSGSVFAVNISRPIWNGGMQPAIFLILSIMSGFGLMIFIHTFFGKHDKNYLNAIEHLGYVLIVAVVIDFILLFGEISTKFSYQGTLTNIKVWDAILFGNYWWNFWLGQVALAGLIPLVLAVIGIKYDKPVLLGVGGLAALVGVYSVRMNIVIPGFIDPQLAGLETAFHGTRLSIGYFPTPIEMLVTVGIIAIFILAYCLTVNIFIPRIRKEILQK